MNIPYKYLAIGLIVSSACMADAKEGTGKYSNAPAAAQFIHNAGQITDQYSKLRSDIDFKIEHGGVVMFGGDGQLHYQWTKNTSPQPSPKEREIISHNGFEKQVTSPLERQGEVSIYRMDVTLVGANKNADVVFEEATGYYENYYLAHTGENGAVAKGYGKVTYKNVYQGIDFILYVNPNNQIPNSKINPKVEIPNPGSSVKYDFIVHPGGNPADIRLRYDGATELKLVDGALVAVTPYGSITEAAPYSYKAETKAAVASKYLLQGNELRFDVGQHEGTLVIDPTLSWATYYGGSGAEFAFGLSSDLEGMVYMSGQTNSSSNIATTGTYQTTLSGDDDVFIVKFNSVGNRLWATYYGGVDEDGVKSIECDDFGYLYVTGQTESTTGIATTGAYQTVHKGDEDAFLAKFSNSGQRIWATYYGDVGYEDSWCVRCTKSGDLYIAGNTRSSANISSSGAYQSSYGGGNSGDGLLVKFNSLGQRLWATYYGGSGGDYFTDIHIANDGWLYVSGGSSSSSAIATTGAHQTTFSGVDDAILVKFNSSGQRQWATYYGGSGNDWSSSAVTDGSGNVYMSGATISPNNISTTGAHQVTHLGGMDGFLVKFNSNGTRQWGTYFSSSSGDQIAKITISPQDKIYVCGLSYGSMQVTLNAHQFWNFGNIESHLSVFNTNGILQYATYYGGTQNDQMLGMCFSYTGLLYTCGASSSVANIATTGAFQSSLSGSHDAFLTSWLPDDTIAFIQHPFADTVWCPADTVRIPYGVNTAFKNGNGFIVQLSNAAGSFTNPITIGTHTDSLADTVVCIVPANTPAGNGYRIRIVANNPGYTSLDNQKDIRINAAPQNFSNSSNTPVCAGDSLKLTGITTTGGITFAWSGPNNFTGMAKDTFIVATLLTDSGNYILTATLDGCSLRDTTKVVIKPRPDKPVASSNSPVCEFHSLQLTTASTTTGASYSWSGPNGYTNNMQNPTVTNSAGSIHAGDYISTATLNGCSRRDTVTVLVLPKPAIPTATAPNSPLCARQNLQLNAATIAGATYNWYGVTGYTANAQNPTRNNIQLNEAGKYYVYATVNGCISDTDSVAVVVNTDPVVNIFPTPGAVICPGKQVIFTAVPTNGGATGYQWYVNGAATGVSTLTYTTVALNNNDKVYCLMVSTGTCATPFTDTSNEITMTVKQALAPKVVITTDAGPSLFPNEPINFTAVHTDAGNAPTFQWKRNGQNVTGANGQVWGANANFLSDGDDICVQIKSSYDCPSPDTAQSNCIKLDIRLRVDDVVNSNNIKVYPNPVKGTLRIETSPDLSPAMLRDRHGEGMVITISNLLGQQLMQQMAKGNNAEVDMSGLAAGVYVVKVNGVYAVRVIKE